MQAYVRAQFVAVDQRGVSAMPDALDFATAAGIPIAGNAAVGSSFVTARGVGCGMIDLCGK
ncbi:MAG: hypothetical protein ABI187_13940 [Ornithinibacter sp.]